MILFPAIDLVAGQVVRLRRGDRSQMDVYSTDPVAVARDFAARGARWVHVVDLSSAFREDAEAVEKNHRAIAAICSLGVIDVDTGGGVRDMDAVRRLVDAGAKRMAIGTALVRAVTAVPGHACFGVFMGIWYGAARRYANEGDFIGERVCRRRALWHYPFLTWGVIARIYWHALLLWIKRAPLHSKPTPPARPVTRSSSPST